MLLQQLSKTAQGVPIKLIHQLYQMVVIPQMLYAASMWLHPTYNTEIDKAIQGSNRTAKKGEQTQWTAMLTITGVMRSSPTDSLKIHTNLLPGPLVIQCILHNSFLHISTLPNHHLLNSIITHIAKCSTVKCHKSALHCLAQNLTVDPSQTELIHPRPVHLNSHTPSPLQ